MLGGVLYAPHRFFANISKNVVAQRRRFWYTCLCTLSAHVVKTSDPGHSRSGYQVTSSDVTSENVWMLVKSTPNARSPWNFERLISLPVSIKRWSWNFDIRDPRSGQLCDLSIKSQWEKKWKAHLLKEKHETLSDIGLQVDLTPWVGILRTLTNDPQTCRQGHFGSWNGTSSFSAIIFDRDQIEQWKHHRCVQLFRTTVRIDWYATWRFSIRSWHLPKIFMTFRGQIIVHSTRLKKRNTMLAK